MEQCTKVGEGKSILLTIMECHWFDYTFWWGDRHPPFDICHSYCDKYRRRGATFTKWYHSMDKYMKLIQDEIAFPSFTPLPSEEEWKEYCSDGVIDTFRCVNCDKKLELRHMRISIQLSIDQRKWLKDIFPDYIKDGAIEFGRIFDLKLMNNFIKTLSTTPKKNVVLFDPFTLGMLDEMFEDYKEIEPSVLKHITDARREGKQYYEGIDNNQLLENFNRDLEMMSIFIEIFEEYASPQMEKPLCCQCINDRISMRGS